MTEEKDTATEIEMETPSAPCGGGLGRGDAASQSPTRGRCRSTPRGSGRASVASAEPASSRQKPMVTPPSRPRTCRKPPPPPPNRHRPRQKPMVTPPSRPRTCRKPPPPPPNRHRPRQKPMVTPPSRHAAVSEASAPRRTGIVPGRSRWSPHRAGRVRVGSLRRTSIVPAEADGHPTEPATYVSEASGAPAEPVSSPAEADGDPTEPATLVSEASAASAEPTPSPAEVAVERVRPPRKPRCLRRACSTPTAAAADEDSLRLAEALVFASAGPVSARALSSFCRTRPTPTP